MVATRVLFGVLALLAGALGFPCARADVYVWVDASGATNVSNLPPPEEARVTRVIKSVPRTAAEEEAARDATRRAELQVLSDRVARLQNELEQSRRDAAWMPAAYAPPPVVYAPPPQYPSWSPPVVSYVAEAAPSPGFSCDYPWGNCGGIGFGGWPYGTSFVVVDGGKHHSHRGGGGRHHGMRPGGPRLFDPFHSTRPFDPFRPRGISRRG